MSSLIEPEELQDEAELVWLESIDGLDYVRQALDRLSSRRRVPRYSRDGRMVGYAVLSASAEPSEASGTFQRRVFFLLPHDRDNEPDGVYASGAPSEAVDPRTVAAGSRGTRPSGPRAARRRRPCGSWG